MAVSIRQLVVERLGPLADRTLDFGRLNLIYGPNETGKTYLVEFLLRSLFREAADWPLREPLGQGRVTVEGLGDEPASFTPDGIKKLEDFWETDGAGMPANMSRLMVVRGADPALTEQHRSGINREVLKAALSSEPLIDRILDGIQATVREASVENGRIEGANRGELKTRAELQADLERLDDLLGQVDRRYSGGRLRTLELQRVELEQQRDQQAAAKRHAAYLLHNQREELKARLAKLPKAQLDELERSIARHQDKQRELDGLRDRWAEARVDAEHAPWLKEAVNLWESQRLDLVGRRNTMLAIAAGGLSILGLLLALALAVLDLIPVASLLVGLSAVGSFGFGMGLWVIYVLRTREQTATTLDLEQRREIEDEYRERFGQAPGGLAGLKAQAQVLLEKQARFTNLAESIDDAEAEIDQLASAIQRSMRALQAEQVSPQGWAEAAKRMREWEQSMSEQVHDLDLRLGKLDVDPSDFQSEPTESEYSAEGLRQLEQQLTQLDQNYQSAEEDLDRLRQEITRETGAGVRASWEQLLESLRSRQQELEGEYRQVTARILGQVAVVQVLERLRSEEDQKIRQELQAPEVSELLSAVTGKYRALDFVNGELMALTEAADYRLSDLSTGAREQVLLALRMGFASRLAGGQPLFLVLDDAFQHSDYERRERMVAQVVTMVEAGWQVTYLTMDDHLSDLFHRAGLQSFGDDYRQHVLEV